jgi:pilus assembly protein Flp/PilA
MQIKGLRKQKGQGMMEYIIIVALIAVAAIGVYSSFGRTVRNQAAGLAQEMAGKKSDTQIKNAGTAATESSTRGNAVKGMGTYNANNDSQ